jgi:hypothetical protein
MPRRPSTFSHADVVRAVKAARDAGLDVGTVEVTRDGTIRVRVTHDSKEQLPADGGNAWDEVLR